MAARLLEAAFGTTDLYAVVGVERDAAAGAVRKAYLRRALKLHPDKSGGDADKFRGLTLAYEVLKDPERRAAFDRDGDIVEDGDDAETASSAEWNDYWRSLFKRVTADDIDKYKADYANSEEERADAIEGYRACGGVLSELMGHVIAEDDEAEGRVVRLIRSAIAAGEIEAMGDFAASAASAASGRRAARRPGGASSASSGKRTSEEPSSALVDAIRGSKAKRAAMAKKEEAEAAAAARALGLGEGEEGLALAMARRGAARGGGLGSLAERYGVPLEGFDAASDAAFGARKPRRRGGRRK